jgi:hypothetical protein
MILELAQSSMAALPLPTVPPDVRTAIATEQLVIATWALFGAGVAAFLATVVAAVYAVRAFRLEESPGLVFAEVLIDVPTMRQVPAAVITRAAKARVLDPMPSLELGPLSLANVERLALGNVVSKTFEVRNVGRSAVVEASVRLRAIVTELEITADISDGTVNTRETVVEGNVRIPSIAANESVLLPVACSAGPCKVQAIAVTALTPTIQERSTNRRRLPFVSSQMLLDRDDAIRSYIHH